MPLVRHWGLLDLEGFAGVGERACVELAESLTALDTQASRFVEQREAAAKRAARIARR